MTAKEKQKYFLEFFYQNLYESKGFHLSISQRSVYNNSVLIYLSSYDNRGGILMINPTFYFKNQVIWNIAQKAGIVNEKVFDKFCRSAQGSFMAAKFGLYDDRTIYYSPYYIGQYNGPFPAGKDFWNFNTPMTLYQVEDVYTQIPGMFADHEHFMEKLGFNAIEMMQTPEGIDRVFNDVLVDCDDTFLVSPAGRNLMDNNFNTPSAVVYSLIAAKLLSDDRYNEVLRRHHLLNEEYYLIADSIRSIEHYFR